MRNQKWLFVLIATVFVVSALAGCQSSSSPAATSAPAASSAAASSAPAASAAATPAKAAEEFVTLKVIYPGPLSTRMEDFTKNELNPRLKEQLNLNIDFTWLSWTDYWTKKTTMLQAGEEVDWCWDGIGNLVQLYAQKQTTPIDDYLQQYGQDILKMIPAKFFEATTINGKIQAIPITNCPSSANYQMINIRQDLLAEVGMTDIKTTADLETFAQKVKQAHPEMNAGSDPVIRAVARDFQDQDYEYLGDSNMIVIGQKDNKVYNFYETDAYKKAAQFERKLAKEGYLNEEVSLKPNESDARMASGNYLWGQASIGKPSEVLDTLKQSVPTGDYMAYLINPGLGKFIAAPGGECIMVPPTAKYPGRAIQFINWILKSKDNYNYVLFGDEGKDWSMDNGRLKTITPADSFLHEWMFRNVQYQEYTASLSEAYIAKYKAWDSNPVYANCFGFAFDTTAVKDKIANCNTVIGQYFNPITTGYVDFEGNYDKALAQLKTAGVDAVVAEYQKQFDAFLATKK